MGDVRTSLGRLNDLLRDFATNPYQTAEFLPDIWWYITSVSSLDL